VKSVIGSLAAVAAGGALGAVGRYVLTAAVHRVMPPGFPYGTLTVNVVGSLAVGVLSGVFAARADSRDHLLQLFLIVGVCGGFTTFSAFSAETFRLIERGAMGAAAGNVVLQVGASLAAVFAGFWLARQL
jgi:CrcB protein